MSRRYNPRDKKVLWGGVMRDIEKKVVSNLRSLSASMISKAGSGHTGISLGATTIFYSLYNNSMKYYPACPNHHNRDRFVMCSGHASALLYASLYSYGFDYSLQDIKDYRTKNSKTPGHPSYNAMLGVDASGGPLGQGIPMAVGMAIAEKKLASRFNKPDLNLVDHYTFCFAGDGGMMEGITNEASSLAGTLGLNKLIVLYDSNNITIEGNTDLAFTENVLARYRSLGWNTIEVENGEDSDAISSAIEVAKLSKNKPTIIKINTQIGFSTPYVNNCKIHGMALNEVDLKTTLNNLGAGAPFVESGDVKKYLQDVVKSHNARLEEQNKVEKEYQTKYPSEYQEYIKWLNDDYSKSVNWSKLSNQEKDEETRTSSFKVLNELAQQVPNLIVGSADLAPSTKVEIVGGGDFSHKNPNGRNLHFGVREHAMGAIANGIALHGGLRIAVSTFMVFSDYLRHAIRMSALMNLPVIYVFTHDSIGVGEDGKTHQPVEFNAMYRATPNLNFIRPADRNEVKIAYKTALNGQKPTILALSRQKVENLSKITGKNAEKGAYVVRDNDAKDVVIFASGSELPLANNVAQMLEKQKVYARVVSVPSVSLFEKQSAAYIKNILTPTANLRVAIEASNDATWYKFIGMNGLFFGVNSFGFTATGEQVYEYFGLTEKNIVKTILKHI